MFFIPTRVSLPHPAVWKRALQRCSWQLRMRTWWTITRRFWRVPRARPETLIGVSGTTKRSPWCVSWLQDAYNQLDQQEHGREKARPCQHGGHSSVQVWTCILGGRCCGMRCRLLEPEVQNRNARTGANQLAKLSLLYMTFMNSKKTKTSNLDTRNFFYNMFTQFWYANQIWSLN